MSLTGISSTSGVSTFTASNGNAWATSPNDSQSANSLTPEEQKQVEELQERDAEVRRHEQAHMAAAGQYVKSGAKFNFQTGPDGKQYAIGGEVVFDSSPIPNSPEATIQKAKTLKKAALAPEKPSAQDHRAADQATRIEAKARQELAEQRAESLLQTYDKNGKKQPDSRDGKILNFAV